MNIWKQLVAKPIYLTGLVVGALLLAAAAGYFFRNPSAVVTQPQQASTVSPSNTSKCSSKPGPGIYSDDTDGYTIEYPSGWFLVDSRCGIYNTINIVSQSEYAEGLISGSYDGVADGVRILLRVDSGLSVEDHPEKEALKLEDGRSEFPLINEEYKNINGHLAYRAFRQEKKGAPGLNGDPLPRTYSAVEYTFLKDKKLYRVWSEIGTDNYQPLVDQVDSIASTFKFKDSVTLDTSTWQTYENNVWGFSFRYPNDWEKEDKLPKTFVPETERIADKLTLSGPQDHSFIVYANPPGFGAENAIYFFTGRVNQEGRLLVTKKEKGSIGLEALQVDSTYQPYVWISIEKFREVNFFAIFRYPRTTVEATELALLDQILSTFQFTPLR